MVEHSNLDEIVAALEKNLTLRDRAARIAQELIGNVALEAKCVAACDFGELAAEWYSSNKGLESLQMFYMGLAGGLAFGGFYAVGHTIEQGIKHRKRRPNESKLQRYKALVEYAGEGAKYALTTEGSCVFAATTTEALGGLIGSSMGWMSNDPWDPRNIAVRIGILPITFVVGISAMSYFSLNSKREAFRGISKKNALPEVHEVLRESYDGWELSNDKRTMVLNAGKKMLVKERNVPMFERGNHNVDEFSMYEAASTIFPYAPDIKSRVKELMEHGFSKAGYKMVTSEKIFAHDYA